MRDENCNASQEIIEQLKRKFQEAETSADKYLILTTLPKSWSARKIEKEFNASYYMANRSKILQEEKGVLSTPNVKLGSMILSEETVNLVQTFYEEDDISRVCSGKRDFVTISSDNVRISKQRRLVLCNLKEVYQIFKQKYSNIKIGFSKFASLRPGNCILANSSGTHTVCVCIYHQNVKLMFDAVKRNNVLPEHIKTYRDLISEIICADQKSECQLNKCEDCPGATKLINFLKIIHENDIETISFKQWHQVDRCSIETVQMDAQHFIDTFSEKVYQLIPHHFIADYQASYLKHLKLKLKNEECIVICDFSENYSFVIQNEIQGFHWANSQCTIHPFAIYYKNQNNELEFTSLIMIAEFLKHDHFVVRLFIEKCVTFIKNKLDKIGKIYFFSDGSGSQYKNRMTFFNLCNMQKEFNVDAEWHFFATCHGKGPCDALGGVLKRNAAKASLQGADITSARQLYDWATSQSSKINYDFFTMQDYTKIVDKLKNRYNNVKTIKSTQKFHCFIPKNETTLSVKEYSFCKNKKDFKIIKKI